MIDNGKLISVFIYYISVKCIVHVSIINEYIHQNIFLFVLDGISSQLV